MTTAGMLTEQLRDLPGIETPVIKPQSVHVYWKYCLRVEDNVIQRSYALALAYEAKEFLPRPGISRNPPSCARSFKTTHVWQ